MAANTLPISEHRVLVAGFRKVKDPGASGTIDFANIGTALCAVVTAGAESRALPSAASKQLGHRLIVFLQTDGGDLTITGADASVILDTAGDFAEFVVADNDGTLVWRRVSNTSQVESNDVIPADAGTVTLRTDTVANLAADVKTVLDNLETAGLIDASGVTV